MVKERLQHPLQAFTPVATAADIMRKSNVHLGCDQPSLEN